MTPEHAAVSYELLRPQQVKALREAAPIVYVVAGTLEWHSWQNPLGTDSLKAHAICCEAACRHGGVVLPPFYQGLVGTHNWGPEGWRGYTLAYNEEAMFEAAMLGIVRALVYGEWKVIVGVTGHDVPEQRDAMQRAIEAGTAGTDVAGFALMEGELHDGTEEIPFTMDHAAAWETSCMLHAYPECVDMDALRTRHVSTDDCWDIPGPEGIGGPDPLKHASPALGEAIINTMADLIGKKALALLATVQGRKEN